jgi:hypothetical protein
MALPPDDALRRILEAGLRAPSAENRHFLRLHRTDSGIELRTTDLATWAERPHRRVLALLSYGAVVENIALRSAELGWVLEARWWPEPARPELVAELAWHAAPPAADPLARAIESRHTNRRFYRRAALPAATLARLEEAAAAVPGARLLWLDAPPRRRAALALLRLAESERFRRRALHEELFGAVRFELGWRRSAVQGLPPGSLEVEPPLRAGFAALRHWPVMRAAGTLGAPALLGMRAAWLPCRLAPHLGLVLAGGTPGQAEPAAGRALQRAWLAATALGLAFQPMAAPVALAHQHAGGDWVAPAAQRRLHEGLRELASGTNAEAFMFFRLGAAAPASVVTSREPLESCFASD